MTSAINGLVLVGGKSSRMGEAKAWMSFSGLPQWQVCDALLQSFCEQVFFSSSPQLKPALSVDKSRIINDIFSEPCGPLGGIISAFHHYPHHAFFVMACDMPEFSDEAAQFLLSHRNPEKMATVFVHENCNNEPLCAIYEPTIASDLMRAWQRKSFCPRKLLKEVPTELVLIPDQRWIKNINQREDMVLAHKKIMVHFYAQLREEAACEKLEITTTARNLFELFLELKMRFNFSLDQKQLRFAINHHLVDGNNSFGDGDFIVFIPPVSGG